MPEAAAVVEGVKLAVRRTLELNMKKYKRHY